MSTVSTRARSSRSLTMAASSEVSWPTSTRGSEATGRPASALCKSAWLILAAQPAKRASSVSRGTALSAEAGFGGVATFMGFLSNWAGMIGLSSTVPTSTAPLDDRLEVRL